MLRSSTTCVVILLVLAAWISPLSAILTITVNTEFETVEFSGSVTATSSANGRLRWTTPQSFSQNDILIDNLVQNGVIQLTTTGITTGATRIRANGDASDLRLVFAEFSGNTAYTITGTGVAQDYSSAVPDVKATFEALAATNPTLSLATGSNASSSVILTAIPEPASAAQVISLLVLAFCLCRRRARARY